MPASANSTPPRYRIIAPWQFGSKAVLLGLFAGGALGANVSAGVGVLGGIVVATVVYFGLLFFARRLRWSTRTTASISTDPAVAADGGNSNRRD